MGTGGCFIWDRNLEIVFRGSIVVDDRQVSSCLSKSWARNSGKLY